MAIVTEDNDNLDKHFLQMSVSAAKTKQMLEAHFSELRSQINSSLDQRLATLCEEITAVEAGSCSQLKQCEAELQNLLNSTQDVLDKGKI